MYKGVCVCVCVCMCVCVCVCVCRVGVRFADSNSFFLNIQRLLFHFHTIL